MPGGWPLVTPLQAGQSRAEQPGSNSLSGLSGKNYTGEMSSVNYLSLIFFFKVMIQF